MVLSTERLLIEMLAFCHYQRERENLGAPTDHLWMAVCLVFVLACREAKQEPASTMARAAAALDELQAAGVLIANEAIPPVIHDSAEKIQ